MILLLNSLANTFEQNIYEMEVSNNCGPLFGSPEDESPTILGSLLGPLGMETLA